MAKVPATIEAGTPRGITRTLTNFVIESENLTETPMREDVPDQTGAIVDQILYDVRKDLRLTIRSAKTAVTGLPTVNAKITYPSTNGTEYVVDSIEEAGTYNGLRRWNIVAHKFAKQTPAASETYPSAT